MPVPLYTTTDCKTPSSITPSTALNLSTCFVIPGLVSLQYDDVPCASTGTGTPYLIRDPACAVKQSVLDFYKTGSHLRCPSHVASGSIAAVMMRCDRGRRPQPHATRTTSVGAATPSQARRSHRNHRRWRCSCPCSLPCSLPRSLPLLPKCIRPRPPPPPSPTTLNRPPDPDDAPHPYNTSWKPPRPPGTLSLRQTAPPHPPPGFPPRRPPTCTCSTMLSARRDGTPSLDTLTMPARVLFMVQCQATMFCRIRPSPRRCEARSGLEA